LGICFIIGNIGSSSRALAIINFCMFALHP
jgi:hypothetical protein